LFLECRPQEKIILNHSATLLSLVVELNQVLSPLRLGVEVNNDGVAEFEHFGLELVDPFTLKAAYLRQ
jgi:hypothetical protein